MGSPCRQAQGPADTVNAPETWVYTLPSTVGIRDRAPRSHSAHAPAAVPELQSPTRANLFPWQLGRPPPPPPPVPVPRAPGKGAHLQQGTGNSSYFSRGLSQGKHVTPRCWQHLHFRIWVPVHI